MGTQAAVEQLEIGGEILHRLVRIRVEAPPHERELPPVRLVDVLVADRRGVGRQLELVALDRREQLRVDGRETRRDADRRRKLAHFVAVAVAQQRACALERLVHGVGAGVRIAVGVTADPRAEAERSRRVRRVPPVVGEQLLRRVDEALLEEPVAVANLVDDARPVRPHLVRLPERGDLGGELVLDRVAAVRRVVELAEKRRDPKVRREHGAARGLGRVRRQDELQGDALHDLAGRDAGERLLERLGQHALLLRVGAPAADPVLLLRDVRELEVERERAEDARLPLEREAGDSGGEIVVRRAVARRPRERADALDVGEQRLVLLLDEHLPEQVAEQADVAPQRRIGRGLADGHPASVGRTRRKTAQSFAQVEKPR